MYDIPDLKTHEEHSLQRYGKKFTELHKWMDFPVRSYGPKHRMFRHDAHKTPQDAKKLFGKNADHACLDHIIMDLEETAKLRRKPHGNKAFSVRIPKILQKRIHEFCLFTRQNRSYVIRKFIKSGLVKYAHIELLNRWREDRFVKVNKQLSRMNSDEWMCERCYAEEDVGLYYIDGNVNNYRPDNVVFLCKFCLKQLRKSLCSYDPEEKFAAWFFFED